MGETPNFDETLSTLVRMALAAGDMILQGSESSSNNTSLRCQWSSQGEVELYACQLSTITQCVLEAYST